MQIYSLIQISLIFREGNRIRTQGITELKIRRLDIEIKRLVRPNENKTHPGWF